MKRQIKIALAVFIAFISLNTAMMFGFLTPYIIKLYDSPTLTMIDNGGKRVADKWQSFVRNGERRDNRPDADLHFSSIFTPLRGRVVDIPPPERSGSGGAVTSWGGDIVLLTHEGKIYVVDPDLNYKLTKIAAPENGFEDYKAASIRPPYNTYNHNLGSFRYNDISAFRAGGRRGLVVSYTKFDANQACYTTSVARLYVEDQSLSGVQASAEQWTDIYRTAPCLPLKKELRAIEGQMAGGRFEFDGKHTIYLASGDYAWDGIYGPRSLSKDGRPLAQDPSADYGKVISIDIETGAARQISRGHRNTQGIAIDRSGAIWVVEHGARGGDELNRVVEGGNYGWPLESYGTRYNALPLRSTLSFGRHETFRRPAIAWLPSIAVSGLTRVEDFHEAWDGDLLAASLRGTLLARIRVADDRVIFTEFIQIGERIRYIHQHTDGRIVLWTDKKQLIFVGPEKGGFGMKFVEDRLANMKVENEVVKKVRVAFGACTECHSLNRGDHTNAPSLASIYEAQIGATTFPKYSKAMQTDKRVWNRERLAAFLRDPQRIIPQTNMPNPNLDDPAVIDHIVDILKDLATAVW